MPIIGGNAGGSATVAQTATVKIPNTSFSYSATRMEDLGAAEYTQVGVVSDASPSVEPFKKEMEDMLATVLSALSLSPRASNLLMRHTIFSSDVRENHGWKMLPDLKAADYDNCLKIGGGTALFDAAYESIEVMNDSAQKLTQAKYTVNGITFFITDGEDNMSGQRPSSIKAKLQKAQQDETIESHITILIGVGCGDGKKPRDGREQRLYDYLTSFKNEAGLTHFIPMADATKSSLAKLAAFISQSVSSQSQALGTGGPSQQLNTSQTLTI